MKRLIYNVPLQRSNIKFRGCARHGLGKKEMLSKRISVLYVMMLTSALFCHAQISEILMQKAENGNAKAQYELARSYMRYKKDTVQAINWYKRASNQGYKSANFELAILYWRKKQYSESAEYCAKSSPGLPWELLGDYYKEGKGVEQNYSKAAYWYEKYLSLSTPKKKSDYWTYYSESNMMKLAQCYDSIANYSNALKWYDEILTGKFDPDAKRDDVSIARAIAGKIRILHLGLAGHKDNNLVNALLADLYKAVGAYRISSYAMDFALERDDAMTLFWTNYAVKHDSKIAKYWMGLICELGKYGVERSDAKAFEWYQKAAEDGYIDAFLPLGIMYEKGRGISQDYERAYKLYEMIIDYCANRDGKEYLNAGAMGRIGVMLYNGNHVNADRDRAFGYLQCGILRYKDPEAMRILSSCYRYGLGTKRNDNEADYWLKKAEECGDETARWLNEIANKKPDIISR